MRAKAKTAFSSKCPYIRDHSWLKAAFSVATFVGAVLFLQSPLDMPFTKQEACQLAIRPGLRAIGACHAAAQRRLRSLIVQLRGNPSSIAGI
ncbi:MULTISPECIES: hypothetical protein [unclassified Rhizobium]|uniref:hypothetical protein n=1 Tax=unclassified Rhizobium TaxID=2613769 RepID=UPI000716009C|nr:MULTISPECIES: hypothetical protein [unclassified Rhizobium]KQS96213.1 hypothetical protein ASG50_03850 [Rhizobium sp. Leaf386]KQT06051.1 hypothetical protein ASG42_00095 [Rhizobium sp. Leaf391]KQU09712.1 hypothetical protein ASG68_01525 [Rhizobium sp. Leaf453]